MKAKLKLSLAPQNIDSDWWYYEENRAVFLYHQDRNGILHETKIPWWMLIASVKRYKAGRKRGTK